jgi:glycosyltransferase involved in cell wall biosynthesis
LRAELALHDCRVLVYSGNLGVGHEFETLLRALATARRDLPTLRLVVFGNGARLTEVRELAIRMGLRDQVIFELPVAADRLPETLGLADLGVVTLRKGFEGLMVPSKLLGYMARGIPVLYVGPPSDVSELVERHGCGLCAANGETDRLARLIVDACNDEARLASMGEAGRRAYQADLCRERALYRYESLMRDCLAAGRP